MSKISWQNPIFVLGNPRSGTSLLRLMLNIHDEICIPPESHFFLYLEDKYKKWSSNNLDEYLDDLFAATKFETWDIQRNELHSFLKRRKITNYAELNSLIYLFYSIKQDKNVQYWGDKNSLWIKKMPKILEHYPNAFFIHIVRDGRDVACSYRDLNRRKIMTQYAPKLPYNITNIAQTWSSNINAIDNFFCKLKDKNKITVKYEDLIFNPQEVLESILRKLDLSFSNEQLDFYKKQKHEIEPELYFSWKEKLTTPLDVTNVGKFKVELKSGEIEEFEEIAKEALSKFQYI